MTDLPVANEGEDFDYDSGGLCDQDGALNTLSEDHNSRRSCTLVMAAWGQDCMEYLGRSIPIGVHSS